MAAPEAPRLGLPGASAAPSSLPLSDEDRVTSTAVVDGWQIAQRLTRLNYQLTRPGARLAAEHMAVEAVLARAARLVGPLRGATQTLVEPMTQPQQGELELDGTLENMLGHRFPERHDWQIERRQERRTQIVLMLDTSLSMAGGNMALAAVAAAVLALKVHPEDLSVVVFEDEAHVISRLDEGKPPEDVVRAMLRQPCTGNTSIEAGLRIGARELARGRNPRRYGLLITDGVYTRGGDPTPLAARFPRLSVLLTVDQEAEASFAAGFVKPLPKRDREGLCRGLAELGHGELHRVDAWSELPRRMVSIADRLLR